MEKQLTSQELPKWAKEIDCTNNAVLSRHSMRGPICHVGSKLNAPEAGDEAARNWRRNFSHLEDPEFVGIDIFEGPNVDVVADVCSDEFAIAHPELGGRFGIVLCRALLEHVQNPFAAAKNIGWLIKPGGHLYFVGPWVWGYHPYPNDYWRISFEALRVLFPDLDWKQWWYSGINDKVGIEIEKPALERKLFAQWTITGPAARITDRGMPYLNIGAVGQKRD